MNADAAPAAKDVGFIRRGLWIYERDTGQAPTNWALIALLNFITQIVFFYEMSGSKSADKIPGEFGMLNAALGIIGLLTVPALALSLAFRLYLANANAQDVRLNALRNSSELLTEVFACLWGVVCLALILLPLPLPILPRFSLQLFALMNVLVALAGVVSATICANSGQSRRWAFLLTGAAMTRLIVGGIFAAYQPYAEAGLAAFLVAGFVSMRPAFREREFDLAALFKAYASTLDRDFLLFAGATLSVLLGLYLFTNADRIAALSWAGNPVRPNAVSSGATPSEFDAYQVTGLLARALLWGTQPLLWMLYSERSRLSRTTSASLQFFWLYLGALLLGALILGFLTQEWSHSWLLPIAENYGPTFAAIMIPLGLLQGLGIFSLASRRYPECFVLGGCSVAYTGVLIFFGRRPDMMLPYMFGSAVVCLMIVLFVGVVRWGRKQP